jgi:hypothetical protein
MRKSHRTLGLYLSSHGFGWIVFERRTPIDWGVVEKKKNRNALCLFAISRIIDRYHPDLLALEAVDHPPKPRAVRIQELGKSVIRLARARHIGTASIGRTDIRAAFPEGAGSRYAVARAVARQLDALSSRLPKKRAIWESEQPNMALFNAAAVVLAVFEQQRSLHTR